VEPGDVLSKKYRLTRRLASGGMGEVWEACHERTRCEVAVKILLPSLARNAEARLRFVREARATARVQHPAIIRVFDAGAVSDGRPYLVMELLRGEPLSERLARETRLAPLETCAIFAEVARGLAAAHASGVCHRDLSSANVFLVRSADGSLPRPKILDFGVSKIDEPENALHPVTLSGSLLGSPAYMSPEQAAGAEAGDARADVWSLGVLLYQSLTGEVPFRARTQHAVLLAIISQPHPPLAQALPGVDRALADTVEGCLVKDPEQRFRSTLEVAERLEKVGRRLAVGGTRAMLAPQRRITDRLGPRVEAAIASAGARTRGLVRRSAAQRGGPILAVTTGCVGLLVGLGLGLAWSPGAVVSPGEDLTDAHATRPAAAPPPGSARRSVSGPVKQSPEVLAQGDSAAAGPR